MVGRPCSVADRHLSYPYRHLSSPYRHLSYPYPHRSTAIESRALEGAQRLNKASPRSWSPRAQSAFSYCQKSRSAIAHRLIQVTVSRSAASWRRCRFPPTGASGKTGAGRSTRFCPALVFTRCSPRIPTKRKTAWVAVFGAGDGIRTRDIQLGKLRNGVVVRGAGWRQMVVGRRVIAELWAVGRLCVVLFAAAYCL